MTRGTLTDGCTRRGFARGMSGTERQEGGMAEEKKAKPGEDKPVAQEDIQADGTKVSEESVIAARRPLGE